MTDSADNSRTGRAGDDLRSELLSSAYRDAVENAAAEPGRAVDDAVRAAARRAVEVAPRRTEASGLRTPLRRWRTPLALAATLLLAVGIALRVYKAEEVKIAPTLPEMRQSVQPELGANHEAKKAQPKIAEEQKATEADSAHPPRDAARSNWEKPAVQPDVAEKAGASREDAASPSGFAADKVTRDSRAENGTARAPQVETELERQEAQPTAKPFPGGAGVMQVPPPAREPAAVPRAPMPGQTVEAPALNQSRSSLQGRAERKEEEKALAGSTTAVELIAKRLDGRPPEAWIEEVRTLKRAGRNAEATELLVALRKKFPDFTLPDDLK